MVACRICSSPVLKSILDMGLMPLTAHFLDGQMVPNEEPMYPLEIMFCENCTLVQISETVSPKLIFNERYPYYSSVIQSNVEHARIHVENILKDYSLKSDSLVAEVGSNDGYLLKHFVEKKIPVLGIEPSIGTARIAGKKGVNTVCSFFDEKLGARLANDGKRADIIIANNVLAHVPDVVDFCLGLKTLLKPDGTLFIEVPYLRNLIDKCEFDTIYHEHVYYFSLHSLVCLFDLVGLYINDVEQIPIHGGSLRLKINHDKKQSSAVRMVLKEEREIGLNKFDYYAHFRKRIHKSVSEFRSFIIKLKDKGKRIACYGAAAKGIIFLNYISPGEGTFEYVVDKNSVKQGKYLPGVNLPIYPPGKLTEDFPEYTVILAWNWTEEIIGEQTEYLRKGGKFLTAIPDLKVHENIPKSA